DYVLVVLCKGVLEAQVKQDRTAAAGGPHAEREGHPRNYLKPILEVVCPPDSGTEEQRLCSLGLVTSGDHLNTVPNRFEHHVERRAGQPYQTVAEVVTRSFGFLSQRVLCCRSKRPARIQMSDQRFVYHQAHRDVELEPGSSGAKLFASISGRQEDRQTRGDRNS